MGLLTGLLTLPLAPVRGVGWLAWQITQIAEDDVYDITRIRAELQGLAVALDAGAISEEEFDRAEDQLLDRLEYAQRRVRRSSPGPDHILPPIT